MLWSPQEESSVLSCIESTGTTFKNLFFISPTVPFRSNFKEDRRISSFSKYLLEAQFKMRDLKKTNLFIKACIRVKGVLSLLAGLVVMLTLSFQLLFLNVKIGALELVMVYYVIAVLWLFSFIVVGLIMTVYFLNRAVNIPELPNLTDDIGDGLSSEINAPFLKKILGSLFKIQKEKNINTWILSGDIHVFGLTEIISCVDQIRYKILQIVASPIAYKPMHKVAEGLTTTTSEIDFPIDKIENSRTFARNIFYTSKRNFCEIYINQMNNPEKRPIRFYLEDHAYPMTFPSSFLD
jgi:hypothetical protein